MSRSLELSLFNKKLALSITRPATRTRSSEPKAGTDLRPRPRILVVDNDTDTRQLYSELLMDSGYEVDTAEDGEMGWNALRAVRYDPRSYDLLITDYDMPKLSGVDLVRKLRLACMKLPVILASGSRPENTERLQLAAILPKPFPPDQLMQTVKEVLRPDSSASSEGVINR